MARRSSSKNTETNMSTAAHRTKRQTKSASASKPSKAASAPKPLILYQGEPGANSHLACTNAFPGMQPGPSATFEDAFADLQ
jgi:hypothetical protein